MEVAKLVPQVFFDVLARYVPGLVLFGSWIVLIGQDEWSGILDAVLAGHLTNDNALPAATLVLLFVPFIVGYLIAPVAKAVQRGNERGWWLPPRPTLRTREDGTRVWVTRGLWVNVTEDDQVGKAYDWLRYKHPDAGALCAKIRAEFTMHNALAVAFLAITIMTIIAGEFWPWGVSCILLALVMAFRGASTEKTFQKTTLKFQHAAERDPD